ncbi:cardiotrophin-2-like [Mustelus asterias]
MSNVGRLIVTGKEIAFLFLVCSLAQCDSASIAVNTLIRRTHDLTLLLKQKTSCLLSTYLEQMGSPFSEPDFALPEVQLESLPPASIHYLVWRRLSDQERLTANYQAHGLFLEFLQLVMDDLQALGLSQGPGPLADQLTFARAQLEGLVSNVGSLLVAMGYQLPKLSDPLDSDSYGRTNFDRKVRGYIIIRELRDWLDRTERDFKLLSYAYPA